MKPLDRGFFLSYTIIKSKELPMTDTELLALYDEIAEYVDDEILDEADELFEIDEDTDIPDEYYIFIAKKHLETQAL